MTNNEILNVLVKNNRAWDLYVLSRYFYRIGQPLITDSNYEKLHSQVVKSSDELAQEYANRTYDDDPIPEELLKEFEVYAIKPVQCKEKEEFISVLDEDKSNSIRSVTSYRDAFEFMMEKKNAKLDIMTSLKMDGVNTKTLFKDGKFVLALSRGRSGNGFDYTDNLSRIFPHSINTTVSELKVTGESYVTQEGLPILREIYKADGYKTNKSAAISLLRVAHDDEVYKYLRTRVFAAEGLATTLDETFEILEENGFTTVPHKLIRWEEIPSDFEAFTVWLKSEVFDYLKDEQNKEAMPADGVVLEVNDLLWSGEQHNQYVTRQLACKFEYWAFDYYKAKVKRVIYTQKRVVGSFRIEIEPMITNDQCNATFVNAFSPRILIDNGIREGSEIYFERNSGAVNILLYGDKLKKILGKE